MTSRDSLLIISVPYVSNIGWFLFEEFEHRAPSSYPCRDLPFIHIHGLTTLFDEVAGQHARGRVEHLVTAVRLLCEMAWRQIDASAEPIASPCPRHEMRYPVLAEHIVELGRDLSPNSRRLVLSSIPYLASHAAVSIANSRGVRPTKNATCSATIRETQWLISRKKAYRFHSPLCRLCHPRSTICGSWGLGVLIDRYQHWPR